MNPEVEEMRYREILARVLAAPAAALVVASAADAQFQWNRTSDWVPGVAVGSTVGNPGPGPGGPVVWKYEFVSGGPLGSANQWFEQPRQLLKWDDAWWSTGQPAWSKGDDLSPPVQQDRIIHNLHTSTYADIPVLSWINPLGDGAQINVDGSVRLRWTGNGGLGFPVDVDFVVAKFDASAGTVSPLFSDTFSKPTPSATIEEEIIIQIGLSELVFDENDALVISHRGREAFGPMGMWVTVFDQGLNLSLVPTPGVATLLGLAGLALARRRR